MENGQVCNTPLRLFFAGYACSIVGIMDSLRKVWRYVIAKINKQKFSIGLYTYGCYQNTRVGVNSKDSYLLQRKPSSFILL